MSSALTGRKRTTAKTYERTQMADEVRNKDDAKGRVKEAAGNLTGDDDLKREGKVDKATGAAKDGSRRSPTRPRTR
jgi:uncharacterized protein YjbJ (UPF0337 family)